MYYNLQILLETLILILLKDIIHEQGDSYKFENNLNKLFEDYIKTQLDLIDD